ncbi:hypothetical protein ACFL5Q_05635 [Planctomycetota bacterium]
MTTTTTTCDTMHLTRRADGWWITNIPDTITEAGPYDTKKLAERDMHGMGQFFRHENDPEFILGK